MNLLSYPGTARQWRLVRAAIIVLLAITGLAFESAYRGAVEYRSTIAAEHAFEGFCAGVRACDEQRTWIDARFFETSRKRSRNHLRELHDRICGVKP